MLLVVSQAVVNWSRLMMSILKPRTKGFFPASVSVWQQKFFAGLLHKSLLELGIWFKDHDGFFNFADGKAYLLKSSNKINDVESMFKALTSV